MYDALIITHNAMRAKLIEQDYKAYGINIIGKSFRQIMNDETMDGLRFKEVLIEPRVIDYINKELQQKILYLEKESRLNKKIYQDDELHGTNYQANAQ